MGLALFRAGFALHCNYNTIFRLSKWEIESSAVLENKQTKKEFYQVWYNDCLV